MGKIKGKNIKPIKDSIVKTSDSRMSSTNEEEKKEGTESEEEIY